MKKTTYTKSFTGWGFEGWEKIIKMDMPERQDIDLFRSKRSAKDAGDRFEDARDEVPQKIRVTYTVTVEPVK